MGPCVLLKGGELVLKGRNRWRFEAALRHSIETALAPLGPARVRRREGVYVVTDCPDGAVARCQDVMGVNVVHPAVRVPKDLDRAGAAALDLVAGRDAATFAIRARRRDKRFPVTSEQIGVRLGDLVRRRTGLGVDLSAPDVEIGVEVDDHEIFVYTERLAGQGGLPIGVSGQALVLLSGGFDSPVAGYRAMRRGLRCDYVHFTGLPFTTRESVYKAYALVRHLSRFQPGARLFIVPLGKAQRSIATGGAGRLGVVSQRRVMVMTATRLARAHGAEALVTGDALGQVASQTLQNLSVVESATDLPLLRPLLGFDKAEITAEAARIGTKAISELPDEDCCTMLASGVAETRAKLADLQRLERRLDVASLADGLAAQCSVVTPGTGQPPARADLLQV